jgi:hypothetical protein
MEPDRNIAHEHVKRHRWIRRVEKTIDQLLELIDNKPRLDRRKPNLPSDLETRIRELVNHEKESSSISVIKDVSDRAISASKQSSRYVLTLNQSHQAPLSEFEYSDNQKDQPIKWSKWTLDKSLGYYLRTSHPSEIVYLELYVKKNKKDQKRNLVGRYKLDLTELVKRKLVRKRSKNGTTFYDIRIVEKETQKDIVSETVAPPDYLDPGIRALANDWRLDPLRPVVSPDVIESYEEQLKIWLSDSTLPLLVRKHQRNRGHITDHHTGRKIVHCDNASANYFLSSALFDYPFAAKEVPEKLESGELPVGMIADAGATYKGHQSVNMDPPNLNTLNFKICHIEPVGIGYGDITQMDIERLKDHMYRFLSVKNMFLLPKQYGALGELDAFVEVFRDGQ